MTPYLKRDAYANTLDFRHRFLFNTYEVSASFARRMVHGNRQSISGVQPDAVNYFQRPDAGLPLDSTRTSLDGDAEEFNFGKVGGQHLMFESAYQRRSAGFEINDLGYLRRADQRSWNTWVGYFDRQQHFSYNRFQWNNSWWQYWSTNGLPLEAAYNMNTHLKFKNNWGWHMGGTLGQLGTTFDDRAARGGPAVRQDAYVSPWLSINGDDRRAAVPYFNANYFRGSGGRSHSVNVSPEIDYKMSGRFSSATSVSWSHNVSDNQWFGNFTDALGATHYTFAHLDQSPTSATLRLNYTFTPGVSLQVYTQPFVSKGTYGNVRQLSATPRASSYDSRYAAYGDTSVTNNPGGFDFKEFQSNVVFRWEYRPGSALFVVWNEGRQGYLPFEGNTNFQGDVRELMRLHPANTFIVKMSYWVTP